MYNLLEWLCKKYNRHNMKLTLDDSTLTIIKNNTPEAELDYFSLCVILGSRFPDVKVKVKEV